jgi:predicted GNAT superfamily acetyltransferase
MSAAPVITVRPLATLEEFHAAEDLQRAVWPGFDLEVLPLHLLTTVAQNGGVVFGAFHGPRLVGLVFGFLGTDEAQPSRTAMTRLKHCSHQLAVHPEYRGQQIGYQLKLAQRDFVSAQGVRLVTWTYDPLESRNARLNIAKLGAVCNTYKREVYGEMADRLNAGLPSDRFQVDWWVTSPRVKERMFGQRAPLVLSSFTSAGAQILNPAQIAAGGLPRPSDRELLLSGTVALVEIPTDFQAIKTADMALARAWRDHTRHVFEAAFSNGYWITDFFYEPVEGQLRSIYALSTGIVRIEPADLA